MNDMTTAIAEAKFDITESAARRLAALIAARRRLLRLPV